MGHFDYPSYVPVAAKRAKAEKKIRQLKKKNPNLAPVIIEGRTLARTWWGKSWNANLERYADYSNRIGRGRSYVRHMAVLDLQIGRAQVDALVQGSRSKPYEVAISIKALSKSNWKAITTACADKLDSLQDLLAGRFPKSLAHLFMQEGSGLFPSPKEIHFDCSCPDWAYMCKHVAAVLYGIGARLDHDPSLFFKLRQVDMNDLIAKAIQTTSKTWIEKAAEDDSTPAIADADLGAVFGIDMDAAPEFAATPPKGAKSANKKKPQKAVRSVRKTARPKATAKPVDEKKAILDLVQAAKKGITAGELHQQSGIAMVKIRNVLYLAHRKGEIRKVSRGLYGSLKRRPATLTDEILEIIANHAKGVGVGELVKHSGREEKQVRNILSRLFKSGKIRRVGRGVYVAG